MLHSKLRAMPGQTPPARLEGSPKAEIVGFLCFFKCLLLLIAALAGVNAGTTTSAVTQVASVKSWIAILLMPQETVSAARIFHSALWITSTVASRPSGTRYVGTGVN